MKARENEFLKVSGCRYVRAKVRNRVGNVSAHHITAVCVVGRLVVCECIWATTNALELLETQLDALA